MSTINKVILVGHIGKEPSLRTLSNQSKVLSFPLATTEIITSSHRTTREHTEWHQVIMWNQVAEAAGRSLVKGKLVYIEGKISTRRFIDEQGVRRFATEVVAALFKPLGY